MKLKFPELTLEQLRRYLEVTRKGTRNPDNRAMAVVFLKYRKKNYLNV